jgi:hypothetical protein
MISIQKLFILVSLTSTSGILVSMTHKIIVLLSLLKCVFRIRTRSTEDMLSIFKNQY